MTRHLLIFSLFMALCHAAIGSANAAEGRAHKIVDAGDTKVDVIEEGSGPPVVLLPSTGRGQEDFDQLAAALAKDGYHVLRPQPRGIGESKGTMTGITYHDFARDIAAVIRQAGGGPAVIAGHAYGNWIARVVSTDFPDLVRGVVLVAAGAKNFPPSLSNEITTINDATKPESVRLKALQVAFFAPGHDPSPWLEGWYPAVTKAQREAGSKTSRESWWSGGTVPMLDLVAADDPFRPQETLEELKISFGARVAVRVIPNASHALPDEQPEAVARCIVDWTKGL
jgi:pimeloyl-ACP methyl ester carboxylesterase